jgi:hypothetical protein
VTDEPRLQWNDYTKVSADELKLLHAGPHATGPNKKAYVAVGRRDDWNLCSLPVHNGFDNYLPNFIESLLADVLEEDAYATMNAMFKHGHRYCRHPALQAVYGPDDKPLREAYRRSDGIARLNACWVDVDCHQIGLTHGQVIGQVYDLQRDGTIPAPSYLKDSGRGLWIVWLLGKETRSFPEHVTLWRVMQAKLAAMFASSGSDRGSGVDPARLSRCVGSVNSKTDDRKRATMVVFGRDGSGSAIRYGLHELAERIGIEHTPKAKLTKKSDTVSLTNKEKGHRGQYLRWKTDQDRFWLLVETLRRTIPVGTRNAHNLVIGGILRGRYKYEMDAIHAAIEDAARRVWKCHPKTDDREYTLDRVRKEIKQTVFGRQAGIMLTGQTIADRLKLTTEEAEQIRDVIRTSGKGTWPPAAGQEQLSRPLTHDERRTRVRDFILANGLIEHPSNRDVASMLEDAGLKASRELVRVIRSELRPPAPTPDATPRPLPTFDEKDLVKVIKKQRLKHGLDDTVSKS